MRSAFAEAIEAFLQGGGKVTHCPEGNGLAPREPKKHQEVGNAARNRRRLNRLCLQVLKAMGEVGGALTLLEIADAAGVHHVHLRRVVLALESDGRVSREGGGVKGCTRRWRLKPANSNSKISEVA